VADAPVNRRFYKRLPRSKSSMPHKRNTESSSSRLENGFSTWEYVIRITEAASTGNEVLQIVVYGKCKQLYIVHPAWSNGKQFKAPV
jgi:hypothetical protein